MAKRLSELSDDALQVEIAKALDKLRTLTRESARRASGVRPTPRQTRPDTHMTSEQLAELRALPRNPAPPGWKPIAPGKYP